MLALQIRAELRGLLARGARPVGVLPKERRLKRLRAERSTCTADRQTDRQQHTPAPHSLATSKPELLTLPAAPHTAHACERTAAAAVEVAV